MGLWAVVLTLGVGVGSAQELPWQALTHIPAERTAQPAWVRPGKSRPFLLKRPTLQALLRAAPLEGAPAAAPIVVQLPMPDGSFARFHVSESPVMAPELAAKYPAIKTYAATGIDDPQATARFDLTPAGFHAQVLSPRGAVYVDPYSKGDDELHVSYYKREYQRGGDGWQCLVDQAAPGLDEELALAANAANRSGPTLRTYRLACAATGEYTTFHGGTVTSGLAAIVTAINRVTGIYEQEMAIRLVLVANNDLIVYTNGATDPYTNNNGSTMLGQNQSNLDRVIDSANYDIGHVFSTGGGGIAYLQAVCNNSLKAGGVTGLPSPTGDAFYVDYVAHEMGHQFGGNHTFNSTTGNCGGGNRASSAAYEPGSGSTIMAYAGICGADNLQSNSDPYFHSKSFDEIITFSTAGGGNSCASQSATGNTAPTVSAGANYTIPQSTPFTLTASGSDPDSDPLTFCWEERDLGPATTLTAADNGSSPLFRSFNPTSDPSRTFPKLSAILSNTASLGEKLPITSRTMNFRVTARDNRAGGGGVNTSDMQVTVTSNAGPFVVTAPNTGGTRSGLQTVTWNVANTASAPVNAANVDILLSTDGGLTFPTVLAAATPNDGSETVTLPNLDTSAARIKIRGAGNIFFDVSDANFTIIPAVPTPQVVLSNAVLTAESCGPGNGAVDPDETVTVDVTLKNIGTANSTNLVVTLQATGGVTSPSGPQDYGTLTPGASATRAFSFTAAGGCGGDVLAMFTHSGGSLTNAFPLGVFVNTPVTNANTASIAVPGSSVSGPASPYPSVITVGGLSGTVSQVTVTLINLNHTRPADLDIVLVAPSGEKVMLMSDAGSGNDLVNVTLTFDDAAANPLPDGSAITPGTYQPTDYEAGETLPAPAPSGPYATLLASFQGINPNGDWSLYLNDDASPDKGSLSGGWRLNLVTRSGSCCTEPPPPPPQLAVMPAALDFGTMDVGSSSNQTFLAINTGGLTLSGTATSAAPFEVTDGGAYALAAGATQTVTVAFSPTGAGSFTNHVIFASNGGVSTNPVTGTAVVPTADLALAKIGSPNPVTLGTLLTWTLTATNQGPADAGSVTINDPLPAGVEFLSATPTQGNCVTNAGVIICDLGTLTANAQAGVSVIVTPVQSGLLTNIATVATSAPDPIASNDTAVAIVLVPVDADGDEVPDDYELANGYDPSEPADAGWDDDTDGMTTLQEYLAGTDPRDGTDYLRITHIELIGAELELTFPSVVGRTYRVQWKEFFDAPTWNPLTNGVSGTGGDITIPDLGAGDQTNRWYRLGLE